MLQNRSQIQDNCQYNQRHSCTDSSEQLPSSVKAMRDMHISGNIVPMQWLKALTFENGKPDFPSILILSDIVYWYRPSEVRDERTGAVIGFKKKFAEDLLRRSYSDLEQTFGISKKQAQHSLKRLEEKWGKKYPIVIESWQNNWEELSAYFEYILHRKRC